jgi:hypothetical protein
MTTSQKRINIILFYILLIAVFAGVIYFIAKPEMTCTDGIKNQGEEKTDCGGPCNPCRKKLQVEQIQINSIERAVDSKGGEDILIEVYNPNEEYGAQSFKYEIYENTAGENISRYKGENFILPKETKHIIVNNYIAQNKANQLTVSIKEESVLWKKITNFRDPNLIVYNDKYTLETQGSAYSALTGLLVNKSAVDYGLVKVKGILRNPAGVLVSASHQIVETMPSGTKREFRIIFPMKFSEEIATNKIEIETNIFDSENYLKTRGQQDTWDQ